MRLLYLVVLLSGCASATCQSTFTTHNASQITWCVTANGEIEQLSIPDNYNQLTSEGYAFCTSSAEYWSVGGQDSGNWKAPVITQPKGPNTLPLTISRASLDGQVVITQTFTWPNTLKSVGIKMKVYPGQGTLIRYAELDPTQSQSRRTNSSAFGWVDGFIATLMRQTSPLGTSSLTNGGIRNLCSQSSTNSNQALEMRWQVFGIQKWADYFEYSAIR